MVLFYSSFDFHRNTNETLFVLLSTKSCNSLLLFDSPGESLRFSILLLGILPEWVVAFHILLIILNLYFRS